MSLSVLLWLHLSDQQFYCLLRGDLNLRFDGNTQWQLSYMLLIEQADPKQRWFNNIKNFSSKCKNQLNDPALLFIYLFIYFYILYVVVLYMPHLLCLYVLFMHFISYSVTGRGIMEEKSDVIFHLYKNIKNRSHEYKYRVFRQQMCWCRVIWFDVNGWFPDAFRVNLFPLEKFRFMH